jgi:activator of HSP90 ATPase
MQTNLWSRRHFSVRLGSLFSGLGLAGAAYGAAIGRLPAGARAEACAGASGALAGGEEISRNAESIHQEVLFKASRKRIYEALTDAEQFTKVVRLSKAPGGPAAMISKEAGGAFSAFGGYITGRHIERAPNERIVQAWRAGGWEPGRIPSHGLN